MRARASPISCFYAHALPFFAFFLVAVQCAQCASTLGFVQDRRDRDAELLKKKLNHDEEHVAHAKRAAADVASEAKAHVKVQLPSDECDASFRLSMNALHSHTNASENLFAQISTAMLAASQMAAKCERHQIRYPLIKNLEFLKPLLKFLFLKKKNNTIILL